MPEPLSPEREAEIRAARYTLRTTSPAAADIAIDDLLDELDRVRGERDELYSQADFWRESYRLAKGYTDDELNARLAIDEATRPHRPPCHFPSSPDCTCKGGESR